MLKLKTLKPKPYKPNTPNPEAQTYKLENKSLKLHSLKHDNDNLKKT